jgi:modulator of drug activity B
MSVDEANVALHKTFQFCGATPLSSYAVHDVYGSNFNIDNALKGLQDTLKENF